MTSIAILHRESIIEQLAAGKRLSDVVAALGVSPQAISAVLRTDPEYRAAIEAGFAVRLDQSEQAIEDSVDQLDVARARARFQSVAWRAERECPGTWGQRSAVAIDAALTVHVVRLGAPESPMIEGSAVKMGVSLGVSNPVLSDQSDIDQ